MTDATETLIICPQEEPELVDNLTISIGILTAIGTIIGYFLQQRQARNDAAEAKIKEDCDLDREQALERVRMQLSTLIGPLHRLWKTQTTISMVYRRQSSHGWDEYSHAVLHKGHTYWQTNLRDDFLEPFSEDPYSDDAVLYRNYVTRRLKPIYTRIRELVLAHMYLADMPSQEEWLSRYSEDSIQSPHTGSINANVAFDAFTAYTFEFDDILESWAHEDFRRMQPTAKVPWIICNELVDLLYDNAREKEARYNKHVTVHKNTAQASIEDLVRNNTIDKVMRKSEIISKELGDNVKQLAQAKGKQDTDEPI